MPTIPKILTDRLSWADNRIYNLDLRFIQFTNTITHEVVTKKDCDEVKQVLKFKLKIPEEIPTELCFLAGDCIHNLRSVLDNIVWHVGKANNIANRYLGDLRFPICLTPSSFDESLCKINHLPQPIIDTIRSLQPYQEYQGRNEPKSHPLRILHRLWNDDKHRTPVLVLCFHTSTQLMPIPNKRALPDGRIMYGSRLANLTIKTGGKLCDDYEYATIIQNIGEPEPNLKIRLAFQISFDEGGKPERQSATECLRNLHKFVCEEVITKFEPFFK